MRTHRGFVCTPGPCPCCSFADLGHGLAQQVPSSAADRVFCNAQGTAAIAICRRCASMCRVTLGREPTLIAFTDPLVATILRECDVEGNGVQDIIDAQREIAASIIG
jgi:hypothetical protein